MILLSLFSDEDKYFDDRIRDCSVAILKEFLLLDLLEESSISLSEEENIYRSSHLFKSHLEIISGKV